MSAVPRSPLLSELKKGLIAEYSHSEMELKYATFGAGGNLGKHLINAAFWFSGQKSHSSKFGTRPLGALGF